MSITLTRNSFSKIQPRAIEPPPESSVRSAKHGEIQKTEKVESVAIAWMELSKAKNAPTEAKENQDPRIEALSREKGHMKEKLERLREELKMIKKVWANDPEELAAQLVRLAKELNKLMKTYKKVMKELAELGEKAGPVMSFGAVNIGASGASVTKETSSSPEGHDPAERQAEDVSVESDVAIDDVDGAKVEQSEVSKSPDDGTVKIPTPTERLSAQNAYKKVEFERYRLDQTDEAIALRGDIEFAQHLRGFAGKLREAFEVIKKKSMNLPGHSQQRNKMLEKVGKYLKETESEMFDFEGALKRAMPPAIWVSKQI